MTPSQASTPVPEPFVDWPSVASDGLFAGVLGFLAVAAAFLIRDAVLGTALHTPSVLGAVLFYGGPSVAEHVGADVRMALAFSGVQAVAFVVLGLGISYVAALVEHAPKYWYLAFVALAFLLAGIVYVDGAFGIAGLGRFQLSAIALLGSSVVVAYLLWQHPAILKHLNDVWSD